MNLLSVFDPDLLIYKYEDWLHKQHSCQIRFDNLTFHNSKVRQHNFAIVLTNEFAAILVSQSILVNSDLHKIPNIRELRILINKILSNAKYYCEKQFISFEIRPKGIICEHIQETNTIETWKKLLLGCLHENPVVATWNGSQKSPLPDYLELKYKEQEVEIEKSQTLPLVWDEYTWAKHIIDQPWWPEFKHSNDYWREMVELFYKSRIDIQQCNTASSKLFHFSCTENFWKDANHHFKVKKAKMELLEALTFKIYKIQGQRIKDHPFKGNTFRMTGFGDWRIHYEPTDIGILFTECGHHSMGGVK